MSETKCQSKKPEFCPYHGTPQYQDNSLKNRVRFLLQGNPVYFAPFTQKGKLKSSIVFTPANKAAKTEPHKITVEADDYNTLLTKVEQELSATQLKEYKTGYVAKITIPNSDTKNSVVIENTIHPHHEKFLDEPTLADGTEGLKTAVLKKYKKKASHAETFDTVINALKDSPIAQNVNGAKTIAVVEAMNEFGYFHLGKDRSSYEVEATFNSILNRTPEYTNRSHGIRTFFEYKPNGELRNARFSLDEPDSIWNVYTQEQVDRMNNKLKKYFESFN